jgi:hypothetical protein
VHQRAYGRGEADVTGREPPRERFEWALLAEQGRYAEAVRDISKALQDEFSRFPAPPDPALREKIGTLEDAVGALTDLNDRMNLVRLIGDAVASYKNAKSDEERDRALAAVLLVLEALDRRVPDAREA